MFFELQLSAPVFTRIVRNRFKSIPICRHYEDTDENGVPIVLDHVEIKDGTFLQREQIVEVNLNGQPIREERSTQVVWLFSPQNFTSITVPFMQVKQDIEVHFVKFSDLEANGVNASPIHKSIPLSPVFNVSLAAANPTQGGGPLTLSYSFAYIEWGFLLLALSETQRNRIQQMLANFTIPPVEVDLSSLTDLLDRPVSAINAGITCDAGGNFVALRVDFDVLSSQVSLGRWFFEDGPTNVLCGREWAMLIDKTILTEQASKKLKEALEGDSKTKLKEGPNASWNAADASIGIEAEIELVDACPFFVGDIDMDASIEITISFSVPAPNNMRWHYHIEGNASNWLEEIGCSLTAALLWPFIGPILLEDEKDGLPIYIAGLVSNFLFGPGVLCLGILAAIETKGLSKDLSKDLGTTCKKKDDEHYECENQLNVVMELSPGLNSQLQLLAIGGSAQGLVLSGAVTNLKDFFMGSLEPIQAKPFAWQLVGGCRGHGQNNFSVRNQASISVFGTPPARLCMAMVLDDRENEFQLLHDEFTITVVPRFQQAYINAPYPCRVRVITNRGIRTINLGIPIAITEQEKDELEVARWRGIASCKVWERNFTPIEKIKWLPDPPFGGRPTIHFWQLVVKGLPEQESLRVLHPDGRLLVTVQPISGTVPISLLFDEESAPRELLLERSVNPVHEGPGLELALQQTVLEHRSTLRIRGPVTSMRFSGGVRNRQLTVVAGENEITWDLRQANAPALLRNVSISKDHHQSLAIQRVRVIGGSLSESLENVMERLQDKLGHVEAAGSPGVAGLRKSFYIRTKQGAFLYDISKELREVHRYEQLPWYEHVVLGGNMLVRYKEEEGVLEVFARVKEI